jgi:hypothetical protein
MAAHQGDRDYRHIPPEEQLVINTPSASAYGRARGLSVDFPLISLAGLEWYRPEV